ncbi:hypothetical protein KEM48_001406 [Puccinia striiformis f. sp. tritici PST-130]|nr:hypothetical protein KEM48_001406 [Puccinia striiformis f. sp. tritici PST-130]
MCTLCARQVLCSDKSGDRIRRFPPNPQPKKRSNYPRRVRTPGTTPTQTQASTWRASTSGSKEPKMTVTRMIYNSIMKRNSTYVSTIFAGSFIFSIGFDTITSRWWEQHNKQKLWSTVRDNRYMIRGELSSVMVISC